MRLLFFLFGRAIHRYIEQTRTRPTGFDGMEYAYTIDGVDFWTWVDLSAFPASRQKHVERCLKFAEAHISDATLDTMCDHLEEALSQGMKRGKDADKALLRCAHITQELRKRPKDVIPEDVFYDLCALFVARKGEDPRAFDPAIHTEKIALITAAGRAGHDFFTHPPELRRLLVSSSGTVKSFADLLISWTAHRIRMRAFTEVHSKRL